MAEWKYKYEKKKNYDDKELPLCYNQLKALYFCKRHHITVFTGAHHFEEGREEGRELGERQKIISQIVKKLQKDKSVAEIADDLEEKEEVIAPIYEAALSMKPDYDVEKIYELLEKNKKLA